MARLQLDIRFLTPFLRLFAIIHLLFQGTLGELFIEPHGPRFVEEPKPAVFDLSGRSQQNYISLRCVAEGHPTPTYEWYKEEYESSRQKTRLIDPLVDNRITLTDGTLTVFNPQQGQDRGKYHCRASNAFGSVVSETVQLSFGCKSKSHVNTSCRYPVFIA